VPVIVLLCPLASSATAKSVLANVVPSSGASVRYATRIQSLSAVNLTTSPPDAVTLSLPWNTIAARYVVGQKVKGKVRLAIIGSGGISGGMSRLAYPLVAIM
jgi:hypothetical protein